MSADPDDRPAAPVGSTDAPPAAATGGDEGRERWRRVEQIYTDARTVSGDERMAMLDTACQGDVALRHEVESLLDCERAAAGFIESSAIEVVASALREDDGGELAGSRIGAY